MESSRNDVGRCSGRGLLLRSGLLASLFLCIANFRTLNLDQYFPNAEGDFGFAPSRLINSASVASNDTVAYYDGHAEDYLQSTSAVVTVKASENIVTSNHTRNSGINVMDSFRISKETLATQLPQWTLDYFDWHANQREQLNETNWNASSFLIARCTSIDENCGGLSDRLRPVPFLLRLAYNTNRILLIRWDRPCRLEEFLEPSVHLNWTVPEYMMSLLRRRKGKGSYQFLMKQKTTMTFAAKKKFRIVETRLQLDDGGEKYYLKLVNNTQETYANVYHSMFRALFQPSPALAVVLQQQFDRFGLVPGEYTAAHLRAFYKVEKETVPPETQLAQGINAVNCASHLRPGDPIYIASDSAYAMSVAVEYGQNHGRRIAANVAENTKDPLHLDFASRGNVTHAPSEFFDTFVDLLLLGSARCISTGKGGYADYASVISFDPSCRNSHRWQKCDWKDAA